MRIYPVIMSYLEYRKYIGCQYVLRAIISKTIESSTQKCGNKIKIYTVKNRSLEKRHDGKFLDLKF